MIEGFKPMLASPVDFSKLSYDDLYLSPKLDGIRAIVLDGVVMSRSLKPIPNENVQKRFRHLEYYDGELIVGPANSPTVYRDTNSGVMSKDGDPDVTFHVFDHVEAPELDYLLRWNRLRHNDGLRVVEQRQVLSYEDMLDTEEMYLDNGYEGVMLRKGVGPNSKYKFGRATAKSNSLLKLKRFTDSEFQIVGFEERMHNGNEAFTDELGRTKRSSHQENKVGRGDLGALVLDHPAGSFTCGTGFDDALRSEIWASRDRYLGQWVKVKHFEIGSKDKPRFPVFLGFRDERDL